MVVSHDVAKRGWSDIKDGEMCKIPGVGPIAPETARKIAQDAFLTGVFFDGKDLRHIRRWTRNVPVEVRIALELGPPPEFDGIACVDCGNRGVRVAADGVMPSPEPRGRFRNERDHVEPHTAFGPASIDNLQTRCWSCHRAKTERDRRAGKLKRTGNGRGPP